MKIVRDQVIKTLQHKLQLMKTYEGITLIWAKSTNHANQDITLTASNSINLQVQQAFASQQESRWNNLLRGFISKEWMVAHSQFMTEQGHGQSEQWAPKAIGHLQNFTLNLWNHCNSYLHGIDKKDNRSIQINKLKDRVRTLYDSFDRIHLPHKKNW